MESARGGLRSIALGLAATIVLTPYAATSAFEGQVLLADGRPAARATVSIIGRQGVAVADDRGFFVWTPDPAPPFQVLVVLQGGLYTTPILVEALPGDAVLKLTLAPVVEAVSVTSGAAPHTGGSPASAQTVVLSEDLAQRRPARLADALENVPGTGKSGAGHDAVPSLRGLARGRTLVLLDGTRVTTERRAGPSASFLDPFFLDSIEISRGPGSVAYGSDALGGIVHARTRRPQFDAPWAVRGALGAGEGIPERSAGAEVSAGSERAAVLLQARWREFDDYRSPEGEVFNSGAEDWGFSARLRHRLGGGEISLALQRDRARGLEKAQATSRITRVSYPDEDSRRLKLEYASPPLGGGTRLGVEAFYGTYSLLTEQHRLPAPDQTERISASDVSAGDFGLRARAERAWEEGRGEVGIDVGGRFGLEALGSTQRFDDRGRPLSREEEISIEKAARTDAALFATASSRLGGSPFTFSGGVRGGRVTTRNRGGFFGEQTTQHDVAAGFAALTIEAARGLIVTAQLARGFRDPTLSDRYFRGITGRGFIAGNPDLDPEKSRQLDLAGLYVARRLRVGLYGYLYRIEELIERFETAPGEFAFRNRGSARLRGVEVELQSELASGLFIDAGAQTARGVALDDGSDLADVPEERITAQLSRAWRGRGHALVRASLHRRDSHPGPAEAQVPGYAVVDLGGGLHLSRFLEARLRLRNVLDRRHLASADQDTVLAPGRSASLMLIGAWSGRQP